MAQRSLGQPGVRRQLHPMTTKTTGRAASTKVCTSCQKRKPLDGFAIKNQSRQSRKSTCIVCDQAYQREYYQANSSIRKAKSAEYERKNRHYRQAMIERLAKPERCERCSTPFAATGQHSAAGRCAVMPDGTTLSELTSGCKPIELFEAALYSPDLMWVCRSCNWGVKKRGGPPRPSLAAAIVQLCAQPTSLNSLVESLNAERDVAFNSIEKKLSQLTKDGLLIRLSRGVYQAAR